MCWEWQQQTNKSDTWEGAQSHQMYHKHKQINITPWKRWAPMQKIRQIYENDAPVVSLKVKLILRGYLSQEHLGNSWTGLDFNRAFFFKITDII